MKILLINGSPKGKRSNSLKLALSFIEGVREKEEQNKNEVSFEEADISSMNIGACRGCFSCWNVTPGSCCIKDDMQSVIEKILDADLIVWSFPLYYFNVPGMLKNLIDRQLPMVLPFMSENSSGFGSGGHESRYDVKGKKHVLVSTCGFYSAEGNYNSVTGMFDHFLGRGNYEKIFCGQGELFKIKELSKRTDEYLGFVKKSGAEYASGGISEETREDLNTLLYPKDVFEGMADASWGVSKTTGEKEEEDLVFTRQMALLYNKESYDGKERVLEMNYTDTGHTYQILLGKDGSKVYTDGSLVSTTIIDTPYEVWVAISRGEIGGAEALGKRMYTVSGDFTMMINWDKYFGSTNKTKKNGKKAEDCLKNPSMATLLIPWITFWIAVSINEKYGSLITLGVVALVPLIMSRFRFVLWDRLSLVSVAVLSIFASLTGDAEIPTVTGYAVFGGLWLVSCLTKEPLCASYVKYSYGGEDALNNPLFMKCNYILAFLWGILYILTAVWTFFLRKSGFGIAVTVINNLVPMIMGLFTARFVAWYPAYMARGGKK